MKNDPPSNCSAGIKNDDITNWEATIIGPSGSGKSTIIDIICGFRNFENGIFKVDDKNVYNDIESWQKTIGYIPQNIVIFNDTLRNNILFGSDSRRRPEA